MILTIGAVMSGTKEIASLTLGEIPPDRDGKPRGTRITNYDWYLLHWITRALQREEDKKPQPIQQNQTSALYIKQHFRDLLYADFVRRLETINKIREEEGLPNVEVPNQKAEVPTEQQRPSRKK